MFYMYRLTTEILRFHPIPPLILSLQFLSVNPISLANPRKLKRLSIKNNLGIYLKFKVIHIFFVRLCLILNNLLLTKKSS